MNAKLSKSKALLGSVFGRSRGVTDILKCSLVFG